MICKKCGADVGMNDTFCPVCGEKVEKENRNNNEDYFKNYGSNRKETPHKDTFVIDKYASVGGPRRVLAFIGFGLAFVTILLCWVPYLGVLCGLAAIVLSIFGLRTNKHSFALAGIIIGALATALSVFLTIIITNGIRKLFRESKPERAETRAAILFSIGKSVIREEMSNNKFVMSELDGDYYYVTLDSLIEHNKLSRNPFDNPGEDGGMTIYYNKTTFRYSCTFTGTIYDCTLEFQYNKIVATPIENNN